MLNGVPAFPKILSPFVSHCTPCCFLLLVGVSSFPAACLHLSPIVPLLSCFPLSPIAHCTPSCLLLLDGASAFRRVLSPLVSQCARSCFPLLDGVCALSRVLSPIVSHCTPSCFPLWVLSPFVSHCPLYPFLFLFVGWRVHLFRGFVSPCPRLYPFLFPFVPLVGWSVRLSEGLVSLCLPLPIVPSCFPLLDGASAFRRVLSPLVSPCTPSCCPLLDGVSGLPLIVPHCFPLLDGVSGLVSLCLHCAPSCFPLLDGACPPFRGSCLCLYPSVPLLVALCWMVCPVFL